MTDERLDLALKRAAWRIMGYKDFPVTPLEQSGLDAFAGWAEAIQALLERPESEHDGGCSAGISKAPCKCSQRDRAEAIRKFIKAMLGGDDD